MEWKDVVKELGEASDAHYTLIDAEYKIDWVNPVLEKKGFDNNAVKGSMYYQAFQGMDQPAGHCSTVKAFSEKRIARKTEEGGDGKQYDTISVPIVQENNVQHVLEITREKKGVFTLQDEFKILKHAADHSNASVFIVDSSYRIAYANRNFEQLRGMSKERAMGNVPMLFQTKKDSGLHSAFWNAMKNGTVWK